MINKNTIGLTKLYFVSWWRSFNGPFFSLVFPLLMLLMLGQFVPYKLFAPAYLVYCAVTLGLQSLSISLVQFKSSSLIKRIGQTPITKTQFITSLVGFNLFLIAIACIITFIAMYYLQVLKLVKLEYFIKIPEFVDGKLETVTKVTNHSINWSLIQVKEVLILQLIASFFSVSFGILIGTLSKNSEQAFGSSLCFYFIISFLSGIFFPLSNIKNSKFLDITSRAIPLRPIAEGMTNAFNGNFAWKEHALLTIESKEGAASLAMQIGPQWVWVLYPVGLGLVFLMISIFAFKWE